VKSLLATALLCIALIGCGGNAQRAANAASNVTPPNDAASNQTFALGAQLTPTGAMREDSISENFARGGEVFLSINVTGASQDQRVAVEWLDANGSVLRREARHVGHGTRYVAFSSGRVVASGDYKAIVVIDGRRVSELPFAVL
jgi:hypothetical protein